MLFKLLIRLLTQKQLTRKIRNPEDKYMRVPLIRLLPAIYRVYAVDYENLRIIVANQNPDGIPIAPINPKDLVRR